MSLLYRQYLCRTHYKHFRENGGYYIPEEQFGIACMTMAEARKYGQGKPLYAWRISDLVIYDKPKELSEFHKPIMPTGLRYENDAIARPPQSWCYVEEVEQ